MQLGQKAYVRIEIPVSFWSWSGLVFVGLLFFWSDVLGLVCVLNVDTQIRRLRPTLKIDIEYQLPSL